MLVASQRAGASGIHSDRSWSFLVSDYFGTYICQACCRQVSDVARKREAVAVANNVRKEELGHIHARSHGVAELNTVTVTEAADTSRQI